MSFSSTDEYTRRFKAATAFQLIKAGGTYDVVPANPSANRTLNIIDPGGTDDFLFKSASQTISNKTLGSDLAAGSFKITGLANGTNANDAINLSQLQAATAGLSAKESVRAATTANITLSGAQTIDGVSVIAGDRVLVKNQSTGSQNGIYVCAAGSWTRATDFDGASDIPAAGAVYCFVAEGTVNAETGWILVTNAPYTIGTTALTFTQFNAAASLTAGDGINISGGVISAVGTANRITVSGAGIDIASNYAGQSTITTVGTIGTGTWQGTAISTTYGGTGATSASAGFNNLSPVTTLGDLIYGSGTNTNARLAGNTAATKKFLNQTGTGSASAAPSWDALAGADIPAIALGTVGSNGGISGTLGIANGGTGQTTPTAALTALGGMPFKLPCTTKTNTDYTLVAGTDIVTLWSTGASDRIAALPTAGSGTKGQIFVIQKIDSGSGKIAITPTSCTINGLSSWPIDSRWDGQWVIDDGNNYIII